VCGRPFSLVLGHGEEKVCITKVEVHEEMTGSKNRRISKIRGNTQDDMASRQPHCRGGTRIWRCL
jgi:hypothetical protein